MSSILQKAKAENIAIIGIAKTKSKIPWTVCNKMNNKAAPAATHMNCFRVKGPTIFTSVFINCGSWNLIRFALVYQVESF